MLLLATSPGGGARLAAAEPAYEAASTRRMAERLAQLHRETDPMLNPFRNRERADALRHELAALAATPATPASLARRIDLQYRLATEELNAGATRRALEEITTFERWLAEFANPKPENQSLIRMFRAVAHLRIGEQENCLTNHTVESCLMPIQGGGIHRLPEGSRAAIRFLEEELAASPDSLRARWLLNLAYMTLGEHPAGVPARFRIPASAWESEYQLPRFPDVAARAGLELAGAAGGVVADDFDNDGYLDLLISAWGPRDPVRYFRNNRDGSFTERTAAAGLATVTGSLNLVQADFDNDGHLDFLALRGAWLGRAGNLPSSLLRNNGDGTFDDVTEAAGLLAFRPTQAAVWLDYDRDGRLDLFFGVESTPTNPHPCALYHNNGNGTFSDVTAACGLQISAFVKSVAAADYDNDGWPDLYIASRGQPNILLHNEGPVRTPGAPAGAWRFTDVSREAGVTQPLFSFPSWFFDYDNDGWPDLFVSGYAVRDVGDVAADYLGLPTPAARARLYHNRRDGTFEDVTRAARLDRVLLAMPGNFGDLDNDGFLDFYLGTGDPHLGTLIPNRMFRNAGGRYFQDVTSAGGFGHLQKGHGITFADLDNDGDQDIYSVIGGAYEGDTYRNVLFENPGGTNHWVSLQLEGVKSSRSAIGARIKVTVDTATGPREIFKTVGTGGSFGGSPLRQKIGLGAATGIRQVEVRWPTTGQTQLVAGVKLDRFHRFKEGDAAATVVELRRYRLGGAGAGHGHVH